MSRLHSFLASCLETRYSVELAGQSPVVMEIGVRNEVIDRVVAEYGRINSADSETTSIGRKPADK